MSIEFSIEVGDGRNKSAISFSSLYPDVISIWDKGDGFAAIEIDEIDNTISAIMDVVSFAKSHTINESIKKRKAKRSGVIED